MNGAVLAADPAAAGAGADFSYCSLRDVDLSNAQVSGAVFNNAYLWENALLTMATLLGTHFDGAAIALTSGTINVTLRGIGTIPLPYQPTRIARSSTDGTTTCPNGKHRAMLGRLVDVDLRADVVAADRARTFLIVGRRHVARRDQDFGRPAPRLWGPLVSLTGPTSRTGPWRRTGRSRRSACGAGRRG